MTRDWLEQYRTSLPLAYDADVNGYRERLAGYSPAMLS